MIEQLHLVRPHDRNGKLVMDRWSSEMLEQAMNAYRAACMKAVNAVRRLLCNLANSMQVCGFHHLHALSMLLPKIANRLH